MYIFQFWFVTRICFNLIYLWQLNTGILLLPYLLQCLILIFLVAINKIRSDLMEHWLQTNELFISLHRQISLTSISREFKFMWISREIHVNFTSNELIRETHVKSVFVSFMWISCETHVNFTWKSHIFFHVKFTWSFKIEYFK